jgi:hypothetical protein
MRRGTAIGLGLIAGCGVAAFAFGGWLGSPAEREEEMRRLLYSNKIAIEAGDANTPLALAIRTEEALRQRRDDQKQFVGQIAAAEARVAQRVRAAADMERVTAEIAAIDQKLAQLSASLTDPRLSGVDEIRREMNELKNERAIALLVLVSRKR